MGIGNSLKEQDKFYFFYGAEQKAIPEDKLCFYNAYMNCPFIKYIQHLFDNSELEEREESLEMRRLKKLQRRFKDMFVDVIGNLGVVI